MADQEVNEFRTDAHRRVAGHLTQPRTYAELYTVLSSGDRANLPGTVFAATGDGTLQKILESLLEDGLVKNIGTGAPEEIVSRVADDGDLPTLPKAKAKLYAERAKRPDRHPYPEGEESYLATQVFYARINGPLPAEPPPLEGAALEAAEEENRAEEERAEKLESQREEKS